MSQNILRPGVHMRGHQVLGCTTTVVKSASLGLLCVCEGLDQMGLKSLFCPTETNKKVFTPLFLNVCL